MTDLGSILDNSASCLDSDNDAAQVMGQLFKDLNEIRAGALPEDWRNMTQNFCSSHPLRRMVHQDPFTLRAFKKPRGYAGDAVMLDYVYGGMPPPDTTNIGRRVFRGTTQLSSGLSVIERRNYIAKLIDQTAHEVTGPRILSVACGHLREANYSEAVQSGAVAVLYALDQDSESLGVVGANKPEKANIIPVSASVNGLLRGKIRYSNLDLIYSLGLYDYLNDAIARKLTEKLFEMLAPKGKLVLANYAPDSQARGYMEAFMDWFLIYRDEVELQACACAIDSQRISEITVFRDRYCNIVYLEITKAQ